MTYLTNECNVIPSPFRRIVFGLMSGYFLWQFRNIHIMIVFHEFERFYCSIQENSAAYNIEMPIYNCYHTGQKCGVKYITRVDSWIGRMIFRVSFSCLSFHVYANWKVSTYFSNVICGWAIYSYCSSLFKFIDFVHMKRIAWHNWIKKNEPPPVDISQPFCDYLMIKYMVFMKTDFMPKLRLMTTIHK